MKRTLDGSEPDWNYVAPIPAPEQCAERAARADRRCRVRKPERVRRADQHPDARAAGCGRAQVQPVPHDGALLSDAGGADDRAQPPRRGLRHDRRVRRPVPGLFGKPAEELHAVPEDAAGKRLLDRLLRQVALDAGQHAGPVRPVRPLAERPRLRLLLGLPGRRVRPVRPRDHREQHGDRHTGGQGLLLPRRDGRQDDRVAARRAGPWLGQAVVRVLLDRREPRAASGAARVVGQVQGRVRRGLGQAARADLRAPEGAGCDPGRRGADAPVRRDACLGLTRREPQASLRASERGVRRLLRERRLERRPRDRRGRGDGRARQHARDLHLGRQRREHGRHAHRHVQRADDD